MLPVEPPDELAALPLPDRFEPIAVIGRGGIGQVVRRWRSLLAIRAGAAADDELVRAAPRGPDARPVTTPSPSEASSRAASA